MKNFSKVLQFLWVKLNNFLGHLSVFLHIVMVLIVIFISTQAISFCIVYLQLLNKKEISLLFFEYINNIWGILDLKNITNEIIYSNIASVKMRIEFLMNVSIALIGLLLSLVTCISYFKKNVDFSKKSCFRKKEIFKTGIDDVKIMCDYFEEASYVSIYSYSFGWIAKNEKMKKILTELSKKNKLKLYTGDDIGAVKQRLQDCEPTLLNCLQKSQTSLRFSYIERNNAKYLLYRQEEENRIYVISMHENNESHYLLQVISQLVK